MNKINLKIIRKSCGLSQQEIAKKLKIKQQQYSRYETNENQISLEMFLKILDVFHLDMEIKKIA